MTKVTVNVEFLGGLDSIFDHEKALQVELSKPDSEEITMSDLLHHLHDNYIKNEADKDVFLLDGTIRPGILVLINDTDWELEGEDAYVLQNRDVVAFTSTLHGG